MVPAAVGVERFVLAAGGRVAGPRPHDDVVLGPRIDQVRPRLAVAVPQLLARDHPPQRARHDPAKDDRPWQVKPDHRVCPGPHDLGHPVARVVAIDHPAITLGEGGNPGAERLILQLPPAGQVEHGVELEMRQSECLRQGAGHRRLAGCARSDHRDSLHRSRSWSLRPVHGKHRGTEGGIRTHTRLPSTVFETVASAIPPLRHVGNRSRGAEAGGARREQPAGHPRRWG